MTGEPPEDFDPTGVPRPGDGHREFVLLLAVAIALLALIFTLGYVVYHHLTSEPTSSAQPAQLG